MPNKHFACDNLFAVTHLQVANNMQLMGKPQ